MNAKIASRLRRLCTSLVVAQALAGAQGCVPTIPYTSGTSVSKASVKAIHPGKTTKYELLENFGMPLGIAKKGETLSIPRGKEHEANPSNPGAVIQPRYETVSADAWFEPFSAKRTGPEHRVYYYAYTISTKRSLLVPLYMHEWATTQSDELWCLVNEQNGIVEDFVFHPAGG